MKPEMIEDSAAVFRPMLCIGDKPNRIFGCFGLQFFNGVGRRLLTLEVGWILVLPFDEKGERNLKPIPV